VIIQALKSQTFIEAVLVLLVTALLTGLLVPIMKAKMDDKKGRQTKILESQAKLLDDLTDVLWEFRKLAAEVAYYRKEGRQDGYQKAFVTYDQEGWGVLAQYLSLVSKSRRIAPASIHGELLDLYEELTSIDGKLEGLAQSEQAGSLDSSLDERWRELFGDLYRGFTNRIEDILGRLADELRLTPATKIRHRR